MLVDHGYRNILKGLQELGQSGQIELVESAKFHAILPLIPKKEVKRQIELNRLTNLSFFKNSYKPKGFFLPEMCYSDEAASIIRGMGYEWVIVSGIACQGKWPMDYVSTFKLGSGSMKVFFRDDIISNMISFKNIDAAGFASRIKELAKGKKDAYIITAMDAETFGHHIRGWEKIFLAALYEIIKDSDEVKAVHISDLAEKFPAVKTRPPKPSSWSTSNEEIIDIFRILLLFFIYILIQLERFRFTKTIGITVYPLSIVLYRITVSKELIIGLGVRLCQ